jgi:hypothetical protein
VSVPGPGGTTDQPAFAEVGGMPHVAWVDDGELRVARLGAAGVWEELATSPSQDAGTPAIADVGGTPWVAWSEIDGGDQVLRAARLNAAGTAWEDVSPDGAVLQQPRGFPGRPSLAAVGGVPHVAWTQSDGTNYQVRVKRFAEGAWSPAINLDGDDDALTPDIAAIAGTPHVAWVERNGVNWEVRVARLEGDDWIHLGDPASPLNHSTSDPALQPDLAGLHGVPHVGWIEHDGVNWELRVARLRDGEGDWHEPVGGSSPINRSDAAAADEPSLDAIGGHLFAAWVERGVAADDVHVSRLGTAGLDWTPVGSMVAHGSVGTAQLASVGGIPFVAGTRDGQLHVARLEPEFGPSSAIPGQTGATFLTDVRTFGLSYPVGFEYGDRRTAESEASGEHDTVVAQVDGLAPGTTYAWRPFARAGVGEPVVAGPEQTLTTTSPTAAPRPAQLLVALAQAVRKARTGRRVRVRYFLTAPAAAEVEIRRGRRRVARLAAAGAAGENTVVWNGRRRARAGRYALVVKATGGDGQTASDRGVLVLRRRRH